ncbi:hypothetical protein CEXT_449601, partial [Caerostris extrusa]
KSQGTKVCPKMPTEGCINFVTSCCDSTECKTGEFCCFQEEGCKTACLKPVKNATNGAVLLKNDTCEDFREHL